MNALRLTSAALPDLDPRIEKPRYERHLVTPGIVHFGVGGFHRAHQAVVIDDLLAAGEMSWGICGVGLLPGDATMQAVMRQQDNLYTLVTRAPDGAETVRVVGSIVEYLFAPEQPELVMERLTDPRTRIASLTITEGGYLQDRTTGRFDAKAMDVRTDLASPERPGTAFGYIVEALRRRREQGVFPFAVVSCDNMQGNGDIARNATVGYARQRSEELATWIDENVAFPNSMVDRITPATTHSDKTRLLDLYGLDDAWPVKSESFFQWILEDSLVYGRPPYELVGVELVDDVVPYELMKLRLLNASHQVLAYLGSVAGHRFVHETVQDPIFSTLLRAFWREEAIPTLNAIPGVDFDAYVETLLGRYANPHILDTLERLATDASNRIPVFLLPVVRECLDRGLPVSISALAIAGWAMYAEGVDENGAELVQHDAQSNDLRARAIAGPRAPDGFLGARSIFGAIGEDERFASDFTNALQLLHKTRVPEAIRMITGLGGGNAAV